MTNDTKQTWETPTLEVLGSMAEMTRMPVPPGCDPTLPSGPGSCSGHKGFTNINTPDGSDAELSHPDDGSGAVS